MSDLYASDGTRLHEVTMTIGLLVREGEQEQMARDVRRVLGSRKALKRLLNSIATIAVEGPGMITRVSSTPDGAEVQQPLRSMRPGAVPYARSDEQGRLPLRTPLESVGWLGGANDRLVINEAARSVARAATHNEYGGEDSSIPRVRVRRSRIRASFPCIAVIARGDYHVHGCPSHGAPFRCTVRHRKGTSLKRHQVVELCPHSHGVSYQ